MGAYAITTIPKAGWQELELLAANELRQARSLKKNFVGAAKKLSVGQALPEKTLGHWYNQFSDAQHDANQWWGKSRADAVAQQLFADRDEKKQNKPK
jgi:hypothetical protein